MTKTLQLKCDWCGRSYVASRKSSKFCSTNCRVASSRYDPVAIREQEITHAFYHIGNLRDLAFKNPHMIPEIDEELRKLSNWIHDLTKGDWYKKVIEEQQRRLI